MSGLKLIPVQGNPFLEEVAPWERAAAQKAAAAETVDVKYRGPVNLAPFNCDTITRSSFIQRVCYDASNSYMLISLNGTWYHYCEIDKGTVDELLSADSMGRYFNASIKGRFDCRTHRVPAY
ncbi:KTSC domain-containing protein [Methylocystis sp. B8]|nr:KTSC domain-containing protein [Methylocystis sp. B8]